MIDGLYVERITTEIVNAVRNLHIDRLVDEYPHNKKGEEPKLDKTKLKEFDNGLYKFEEMVEEIVSVALLESGEFYFKTKFNYQDDDARCLHTSIENAMFECFGKNSSALFKKNVNLLVCGYLDKAELKLEFVRDGIFQKIKLDTIENNNNYNFQK